MESIRYSLVTVFICLPLFAWADGHTDPAGLSQSRFHFKHQTFAVGNQVDDHYSTDSERSGDYSSIGSVPGGQSVFLDKSSKLSGSLKQYDATFSYPFTPRETINFDFGINLRFIDANLTRTESEQTSHSLNTALPMFYANAEFGLPYDGLSASLGASHVEYEKYYAYDYRAKLSYQWQNGFGMEGGWQHQALSIDGSDLQADIENEGLFLDFKYRF